MFEGSRPGYSLVPDNDNVPATVSLLMKFSSTVLPNKTDLARVASTYYLQVHTIYSNNVQATIGYPYTHCIGNFIVWTALATS